MSKIDIICEDALAVVDKLGLFDIVITDPPYPVGYSQSFKKKSAAVEARMMNEHVNSSLLAGVLRNINQSDHCYFYICTDWRRVSFVGKILENIGLDRQSCIVWNKVSTTYSNKYHNKIEMIVFATNTKCPGYMGDNLITEPRAGNDRTHVYEKPVNLYVKMLNAFRSQPPLRLLDPFCGTGSALEAGLRLGWDVTGIEIDKNYAEIAEKRLNAITTLQTELRFDNENTETTSTEHKALARGRDHAGRQSGEDHRRERSG